MDGVSVGDMGVKSELVSRRASVATANRAASQIATGNDLDNAWISFDKVRIPKSALLNAHADVDAAGTYQLSSEGVPPFAMIGQRLYTGRVCVAQAALEYRRKLFEVAHDYASSKPVWSPFAPPPVAEGELGPVLSSVPQLRAIFEVPSRASVLAPSPLTHSSPPSPPPRPPSLRRARSEERPWKSSWRGALRNPSMQHWTHWGF